MKTFTAYILVVLSVTALLVVATAGLNYKMLKNSGEYLSAEEIYSRQSEKDSFDIYGSAISDQVIPLKIQAYQNSRPEVISIGSSRTLQFRRAFFTKSFYNMGLTAGSVYELRDILENVLKIHKPKIIIIGADFWWFHPDHENDKPNKTHKWYKPYKDKLKEIQNIALPLQWLFEGSISLEEYRTLLFSTPDQHIGIRGKLRKAGIAPDGSYYYTDRVIGDHLEDQEQFHETLERIERKEFQFIPGDHASSLLVKEFGDLVKNLETQDVQVIVFLTPVAPKIFSELEMRDYKYIQDAKEKFTALKLPYYDFVDPAKAGPATNCEFIDGFHGGDVLHARIIEKIAIGNPEIMAVVDKNYLKRVRHFNGIAMIPEPRLAKKPEVDFLNLGCEKKLEQN